MGTIDEYATAAEGLAGTACSASLAGIRSLVGKAPSSRVFAAIATLTEFSGRIEARLEAGDWALVTGDLGEAAHELAAAVDLIDKMAGAALNECAEDGARPERRRSGLSG